MVFMIKPEETQRNLNRMPDMCICVFTAPKEIYKGSYDPGLLFE
jgi:hypothetical protein